MEDIYTTYDTSNMLLFEEESVLHYRIGGYHPVAIGDTFKLGRYKVHHKLGWGGFSTVWLAYDTKLESWVSMKISKSEETERSRELSAFNELKECRGIVQLLDHFVHHGPNGAHQCLVFELLGPTVNIIIADYREDGDFLETEYILKMSTQLLETVQLMHNLGYAHGDLTPRNLAFGAPRLANLTEKDLMKVLGGAKTEEVKRMDGASLSLGVPSMLVKSAEWTGWPEEDIEDLNDDIEDYTFNDIRIIDLGEAFRHNATPKTLNETVGLRAPEIVFTDTFDYRIDLWRLGLIVYYFTFGSLPFHAFEGFECCDLGASMVDFAGKLPPEWKDIWAQHGPQSPMTPPSVSSDDNGHAKSRLERSFQEQCDRPELEKIFLPMIKGLTELLPSDRWSISQTLHHLGRWFEDETGSWSAR